MAKQALGAFDSETYTSTIPGTAEPWLLPSPPPSGSIISVDPSYVNLLKQQTSSITPISWANANYVASDWWGRYKMPILVAGALTVALVFGSKRR